MAHSVIAVPFPDVNLEDNDNHVAVGMRMIIIIIQQAGHILAGCLTALLLLLPGVVACVLELKRAWREGENPLKGLTKIGSRSNFKNTC